MAERERRQTPPFGGVFLSHARIMTTDDMGRAVQRMAHEVIERNHGLSELVVIGLQTGGVPVAERLVETLEEIAIRARQDFIAAGGEDFLFVPCLNAEPCWTEALAALVRREAD